MKQTSKFTILSGLLAMTALSASASPLSPEASLERALGSPVSGIAPAATGRYSLAYTAIDQKTETPTLYVFNAPSDAGILVLSADDGLPAILGRTYEGSFSGKETLPPSLRWWLGEYERQVSWYNANRDKVAKMREKAAPASDYPEIEPLVKTTWNQSAPYNDMCPEDAGGRSVTGCVATSMAQVINSYQYPATHGEGYHEYDWYGETLSFNYAEESFDWDNMLDDYGWENNIGTDEEKAAVAKLMYACGVSVDMDYSSSMSGALSQMIPVALRDYFGYSDAVSFICRDYCGTASWNVRIYEELSAGRPVIYGGDSQDGGHSFVCDGYGADGYFHINWGWGGAYDGYFLLSALDPEGQGIGGGVGGFNYNQDAVVNIAPAGTPGLSHTNSIYCSGDMQITQYQDYGNGTVGFLAEIFNGGLYNYSGETVVMAPGFKLSYLSQTLGYLFYGYELGELPMFNGYSSWEAEIPVSELWEGDYMITPAYVTPDGEWHDAPVCNGHIQAVYFSVYEDGTFEFNNDGPYIIPEIYVTSISADGGYINLNGESTIKIDVINPGESTYADFVGLYIAGGEDLDDRCVALVNAEIAPGASDTYSFVYENKLEEGVYDFYLTDYLGNPISGRHSIEVKEEKVVMVESITLDVTEAEVNIGDEIQLTATVLPENAADRRISWSSSDDAVASVDENGIVRMLSAGYAVITASALDGSGVTATCMLDVSTSLGEIAAEAEAADVYDFSGHLLKHGASKADIDQLPRGTYIIKRGGVSKKVIK